MKIFRKILYVIAGILVVLTILILLSAYNPGIVKKIQSVIYKGKTVTVTNGSGEEEGSLSEDMIPEAKEIVKRSLEELEISEDSMLTNIDDYYRNCHDQIVEHGLGEYSFENVIANEALIQEIYAKYSNKQYVDSYMNDTLNEIGATNYEMNLLVEELEDGHYRLTHQVVLEAVSQ